MPKYKTFEDLEFYPHEVGDGRRAVMFFENGWGISVVRFKLRLNADFMDVFATRFCKVFMEEDRFSGYDSYTDNENQWEVATVKGTKDNCEFVPFPGYDDPIIGHLLAKDVTMLMKKMQKMPRE